MVDQSLLNIRTMYPDKYLKKWQPRLSKGIRRKRKENLNAFSKYT